jgi:hypothetical protein
MKTTLQTVFLKFIYSHIQRIYTQGFTLMLPSLLFLIRACIL